VWVTPTVITQHLGIGSCTGWHSTMLSLALVADDLRVKHWDIGVSTAGVSCIDHGDIRVRTQRVWPERAFCSCSWDRRFERRKVLTAGLSSGPVS